MGDFYQDGYVTTLHNFRKTPVEELEKRLVKFAKRRPMGLIIPALYSELEKPALAKIVDTLKDIPYISEIVIGLDAADQKQFEHAKEYFSVLPQHHRILWNHGPRLQELRKMLISKKIHYGDAGKGQNVWFCFGYMIASGKSEAVALHDADIITYSRDMVARLYYPVADPTFNYKFCKGYYFRADDEKINGRATRLLVTPLIRTLKKFFPDDEYLEFMDSFRYILSGEFSMRADVMKTVRIPFDWGLEVGILSEVQRNNSFNRICQVEIADSYDHKHQPVSQDNPNSGLSKMSFDIARNLFVKMAINGRIFTKGTFRSIKATYTRIAIDFVERYTADAVINGLSIDRDAEEQTVDLFAQNIYRAGIEFLDYPDLVPYIPSWKRVISAIPEFSDMFYDAVEEDNA
ncbi:hypothetical protein ACE01N_10760 [Saccharicrinis sp. FJH2]|uniref:hypothetical protein n=1 Tax=Saccharicrinis sp. FJH65 TaxID=3344659 RepID=UPI0035F2D138